MSPSSFALVMATGIISIGAHLLDVSVVASALFALNIVFYVILWLLLAARLTYHRTALLTDLTDHRQSFGFLTIVSGTCVLGSQMVVIAHRFTIATVLLIAGAVLWLRRADRAAGGALGQPLRLHANYVALSMWLWGGTLYIWIISLIFYRDTFFRFSAADVAPPYWINMGAMAISVLAGSLLIDNSVDAPFLHSLRPFLEGYTVLYWATGTWGIPMILILAAWRYAVQRLPFEYDPLDWGAVFPLGMYAVARTGGPTRCRSISSTASPTRSSGRRWRPGS